MEGGSRRVWWPARILPLVDVNTNLNSLGPGVIQISEIFGLSGSRLVRVHCVTSYVVSRYSQSSREVTFFPTGVHDGWGCDRDRGCQRGQELGGG